MARTAHRRGWRAQYAPGRVFELKRKTTGGAPVCALAIRDWTPDAPYHARYFVQVDEKGCTEGTYGPSRSRLHVGGIHPDRMSSALIARRRPDLERFDADDLELIRYGCHLQFGGRIENSITKASIPHIEGRSWTVFWTKDDLSWRFGAAAGQELANLLKGHWHIYSRCGGDWTFGRDSHLAGWATVDTDPARLRRIEVHLRRHLPHLEVQTIDMVTVREGDRRVITARGRPCPAIHSRGTTTIWPSGQRGYSISTADH